MDLVPSSPVLGTNRQSSSLLQLQLFEHFVLGFRPDWPGSGSGVHIRRVDGDFLAVVGIDG